MDDVMDGGRISFKTEGPPTALVLGFRVWVYGKHTSFVL